MTQIYAAIGTRGENFEPDPKFLLEDIFADRFEVEVCQAAQLECFQ
ncbi:hypothetical protein SUDANB37_02898 [Streptomyces sp. enrichment culture]